MFVEFDSLPDSSRIWIFQSERKITEIEKDTISNTLLTFTKQWAAHGNPLKSSFKIEYDQFILLAADESMNKASGCSIDDSVGIMREINNTVGLNLFERTNIAFKVGEEIVTYPMTKLSEAFSKGTLNDRSLVFNNVLSTKGDLNEKWIIPAAGTWLKKYFTNIPV